MAKKPTIVVPSLERDFEKALDRAAASGRKAILLRGFPTKGTAAVSVDGKSAPPLSRSYALRKVGRGRHGVSDQRFTSRTASALAVIRSSPGERVIGFRERQDIASYLHKRNNYFGLNEEEKAVALDSLRTLGAGLQRRVRIRNPVIVVEVRV